MKRRTLLRMAFLVWIIVAIVLVSKPLFFDTVDKRESDVNRAEAMPMSEFTGQQMVVEMRLVTGDNNTQVKPCGLNEANIQEKCAQLKYDSLGPLPRTSVIITFHDSETTASLIRTIHSVVQRTPDELLQEIIVIDDFSQKDDLGQLLDIYIRKVFSKKVKLIRNSENLGLIKSRLKGSRLSTGDVVFFMDSHSEVLPGWLEPLLFEIKKNRRTIVTSLIDWIEKQTEGGKWSYRKGCGAVTVVWDYSMGFGWDLLSKEESVRNVTDVVKLRSIIGAYCAIDKRFFQEIGELDEGMEFWGGENIDLPLRAWMFDGQVLTAPCSRVAHLEGDSTRTYRNAFTNTIRRNYKRFVEVWFDDYKDCFYYYFPELVSVDAGNLTDRFRVKAAAHHDFKWYLKNIFPSMGCPVLDSFAYGMATNLGSGRCLSVHSNNVLHTSDCSGNNNAQKAYWSHQFHLRQPNYIWTVSNAADPVKMELYKESFLYNYGNEMATQWIHWKDGPMIHTKTRLCLEASSMDLIVRLLPCNFPLHLNQTWRFDHYTDKYSDLVNRQKPNTYGNIRNILLETMNNSSSLVTQPQTSSVQ